MGQILGYGLLALALFSTVCMNLYTLAQIARARTSVPWADQWAFVEDLEKHMHGAKLWPILWSSYWGHRFVIPRLLFLADARWLSLASLTWLALVLQFAHIALLIALAWLLLGRRSLALFTVAVITILNLMLSPFQIENFVWGMQTMSPLVFVAATGSFFCLSLGSAHNRRSYLALCLVLGIISSYSMPNGILVWPVLVAQSVYLRNSRKMVMALAGLGIAVIASYLWHYQRPLDWGLGASGILRHPIDATQLMGLILGSPFRFTIRADVVVGLVSLAVTGYILIRALFSGLHERRWFSVLLAIMLFSFLSSLSIVAGRLNPGFLHFDSKDPLPGRYFTMICLIWASIGLLALFTFKARRRGWLLCFYGILFASLMFFSMKRQQVEAEDWADFFVKVDAVGCSFLLDIRDEELQSALWASAPERQERIAFLRQHQLAMFHEARAEWAGKRVSDLFLKLNDRCVGAIEKTIDLNGQSWRVEGWAWDLDTSRPPDDILFTDATGRVIGLGRGGLRHGYSPGFVIRPELPPPSHAGFPHSEWLGYVKQDSDFRQTPVSVYGLFRNEGQVCEIKTDQI